VAGESDLNAAGVMARVFQSQFRRSLSEFAEAPLY
jgi:hypothetical protein